MIAVDGSSKGLRSSVRSGLWVRKSVVFGKRANGSSKGLIEEVGSGDLACGRVAGPAAGYLRA